MTRARRPLHRLLMSVAPRSAVRWATDVFSDTRAFTGHAEDRPVLGARRFTVDGCPDVRGGHLWGDPADPVVLLVHGWGADSSTMHSLAPALRDLGFAVAVFDAPAHGVNPGRTATMTQYSAAVAAVLRELGGARAVVAHSLGSIAAVSGAALAGVQPEAVVLLAPTCTLSGVLERWAPADMVATRPVIDGVYRVLHERNGVPVSHWDVRTRAAGLTAPVLVMHDPADPVVPYEDARRIAAELPGAHLVDAPGRGHMGILMAPDIRAAVTAFVTEHTGSGERAAAQGGS